ncbi:MAG: hypothetical protein Q8Q47_12985, partial [Ignavibacteriaceae bacterium]|nr:hypothetical protein [Ignavibacteriaceae bacterium]
MKKLFTMFALVIILGAQTLLAQALFTENFEYTVGEPLTSNTWNITGTSTTNLISVVDSNLTYTGYNLSTGKAAFLTTTGQDVNKAYSSVVNSGNLYVSFLVRVSAAQTVGDYFFHLGISPTNSSIFIGRLFCKLASNGNLSFGLSKSSTNTTVPAVYSDSTYSIGTTYLMVLKYSFNPGTDDDTVKLFINPTLSANEPASTLTHSTLTTGADPVELATVNLRQGTTANAPTLVIDGIKVSTSWLEVIPVEFTSFSATGFENSVRLSWSTSTETNNNGFNVERKSTSGNWENIAFVKGNGTTTSKSNYSYTDQNLNGVKFS